MASTVKFFSLGILFLMSCVSGLVLPFLTIKVLTRNCQTSRSFKKVLGVLNCFSGGVFIATSLLTLLPEGREAAEEAFNLKDNHTEYPVTELIMGLGFLLILVIENVTVSFYAKHQKRLAEQDKPTNSATGSNENQTNELTDGAVHTCNELCSYQSGHVTVTRVGNKLDESREITQTQPKRIDDADHSQNCVTENIYGKGMSNLHSIVLLLALSTHMLFDGLSLGLLAEDKEVWSVLLALSIHKFLIFFSTGITICENTTTAKFTVAMIYLSVVSPLGVGAGIILTSHTNSVALTTAAAVLQAVAVGTFVYVAFFEILVKEFSNGENGGIVKATATVVGYSLFAVLQYVLD